MPMLRGRALKLAVAAALLLALTFGWATPAAAAQAAGDACTTNGTTAAATVASSANNLICVSNVWQYAAYQFGNSSATCDATSAGIMRWTGAAFQGCDGASWGSLGSGGGALSGLTAATTTNSIDNANWAQIWAWGTLSTQTALTLTTSSMTNGSLLSLQNTAVAATSTGKVLSVGNTTTGSGYGVYSAMSGTSNTGYAAYFINGPGTNAGVNYGVYASNNTTGGGYGIYSSIVGNSNTGYAGYFINGPGTNAGVNYGVYASNNTTGGGYGIYSSMVGTSNTGYAGYFINGPGTNAGTNYAVYATNNSTGTGYGVYGALTVAGADGAAIYGTSGGTATSYGVYGAITGNSNTGYAGYFVNGPGTNAGINYGVYASNNTTAAGAAVWGGMLGTNNTGYAGYFANGPASNNGANYGVYATNNSTGAGYGVYGSITGSSNTGYGIYALNNSASGWGVYSGGSSANYFAGSVGIGMTSPSALFSVAGSGYLTGGLGIGTVNPFGSGILNSAATGAFIASQATNSNGTARFQTTISGLGGWYFGIDGGDSNKFKLSIDSGFASPILTVTTGGNVGIGITPSYPLNVLNSIVSQDSGGTNMVQITGQAGSIEIIRSDGSPFIDFKDTTADDYDARIQSLSNGLVFFTGGNGSAAVRMTITSSGDVGVGTTTPSGKLHVLAASATANATVYGIYQSGAMSATNTSGNVIGGYFNPSISATTTVASIYGAYMGPQNTSSGVVTNMYGIASVPVNTSTGTVTSMSALTAITRKAGAGTVANMYGVYARCDNTNASGAVTNCYGLYVDTPVITGAITNKYGIYQVDSNTSNYFAGNVGIGTTTPQAKLNVQSNIALAASQLSLTALGWTPHVRLANNKGAGTDVATWTFNYDSYLGASDNSYGTAGIHLNTSGFPYTNGYLTFHTGGSGAYTERMRIDWAGNVGIGTTTPGTPLDVAGALRSYSASPRFDLYETDASADEKIWRFWGIAGNLYLSAVNDAQGSWSDALVLSRTGTTIDTLTVNSTLYVPDGKYVQFGDNNAGAPPAADCDSDTELGRLSIDTTNNRLYVCNGATRGWDYVALTN